MGRAKIHHRSLPHLEPNTGIKKLMTIAAHTKVALPTIFLSTIFSKLDILFHKLKKKGKADLAEFH
jgi:hypothetical protein